MQKPFRVILGISLGTKEDTRAYMQTKQQWKHTGPADCWSEEEQHKETQQNDTASTPCI